jgi:hypothetical protein
VRAAYFRVRADVPEGGEARRWGEGRRREGEPRDDTAKAATKDVDARVLDDKMMVAKGVITDVGTNSESP